MNVPASLLSALRGSAVIVLAGCATASAAPAPAPAPAGEAPTPLVVAAPSDPLTYDGAAEAARLDRTAHADAAELARRTERLAAAETAARASHPIAPRVHAWMVRCGRG